MKPRTMVFLIAALAACVILILVRTGYRETTERQAGPFPAAGERMFQPGPVGAKELAIVSADGATVTFTNADAKWTMTAPLRARADDYKVNQLVDVLLSNTAQPIAQADLPEDQAAALASPAWTVKLVDSAGRAYSLAIGGQAPMSGGAKTYVRAADSGEVFVADFPFSQKLSCPPSEFRDKSLWDVRQAQIARVTIAGRESYELVRDDGTWQVASPRGTARADQGRVRALLDKLAYLEVSNFVTDSPASLAAYGLDNPRLIVTLHLHNQSPASSTTSSAPATGATTQATQAGRMLALALGGRARDSVYARLLDSPSVLQLPAPLLEELQPPLDEIRDKDLLPAFEQAVVGLDIAGPAGRAALAMRDGQWRMELPYPGPANQDTVGELIQAVQELKAVAFYDELPSLAAYGLDQPRCRITLRLAGTDGQVWLAVGGESPSGEVTFVKSSDGPSVATVRTADVQPLLEPPCAYWSAALLEVPAAQHPKALEVTSSRVRYVLAAGDGRWTMTQPVAAAADGNAVGELLEAVRSVTAEKVVALGETVPRRFAEAKDIVTVKLTSAAEATQPASAQAASEPATRPSLTRQERTYKLHAVKLDGAVYAWAEGGTITAVGQVDDALYAKLTAELRAKGVGLPAGADARRIRITREGTDLVLEQLAGQWRCSLDPHVKISKTKVDALLQNAALLKAVRFAAHRAPKGGALGLDKPSLAVELTDSDGATWRLAVSTEGPGGEERYASATGIDGVFVLSGYSVRGLGKSLEDFLE